MQLSLSALKAQVFLDFNAPFFAFLVRLNTNHTEMGTGHNSVQSGAPLYPLQGRQGRNVQMGLCGAQINNPNRTEALLPARRVMACVGQISLNRNCFSIFYLQYGDRT